MKNKFIVFVGFLILLSMMLSSCIMSNNPDAVYKKIDKNMNKLNSYVANYVIDSVAYVGNVEVTTEAKGKIISSRNVENDLYYYEKATTDVNVGGVQQTITTLESYYNGKHYFSNSSPFSGLSVYSESTAEEFAAYIEKISSSDDTLFINGENKNVERKKGGGYILKYSGFSEENIEKMLDLYGFTAEDLGAEIIDVNVAMDVYKDLRMDTMRIEFVFDEEKLDSDEIHPKLVYEIKYSDFDTAEPITAELEDNRFIETHNVKMLRLFPEMIEDQAKAESGKFNMSMQQRVFKSGEGSLFNNEEIDVSYNDYGDSYTYDLIATVGGKKYNINYADGVVVTKYNSFEQGRQNQTEKDAREYIAMLAGVDTYSLLNVSKIAYKNNVYTFDIQGYDSILGSSLGHGFEVSSYTVKVVVNGDKLENFVVDITCNDINDPTTKVTVTQKVTFE